VEHSALVVTARQQSMPQFQQPAAAAVLTQLSTARMVPVVAVAPVVAMISMAKSL
jgi:hypothetical protein